MWVLPNRRNLPPGWAQKEFTRDQRQGRLLLVASGWPPPGALHINQDVTLHISILDAGQKLKHSLEKGRFGYRLVIDDKLTSTGSASPPTTRADQARTAPGH